MGRSVTCLRAFSPHRQAVAVLIPSVPASLHPFVPPVWTFRLFDVWLRRSQAMHTGFEHVLSPLG